MAYIDNLAYSLFAISFAGFLLLYTIGLMYLTYRKGRKNYAEHLSGASLPLGLLGAYLVVMGLWGQFSWPLPGSYNILFYDPFISFGIVMASFAFAARFGGRLDYVGFLGLLFGIMVIIYGIEGYGIGLTSVPVALLAMYFFYGLAGILSYPVSLIVVTLPGMHKNLWKGWHVILVLFFLVLLAASLLAGYTASSAISAHLLSAP